MATQPHAFLARTACACALTALLAACAESYTGPTWDNQDGIHNTETYDKTPVMVFINEQNIFSLPDTRATRGTGPFDKEDSALGTDFWTRKYTNGTFHIFAFRAFKDIQGPLTADANLTKTLGQGTGGTHDADREDCLVDNPADYNMGYAAKLNPDESGELTMHYRTVALTAPNEQGNEDYLYYSAKYPEMGYHFFGYYIDDLYKDAAGQRQPNFQVSRTPEHVSYTFDIDGAQDVMCGYAPQLTAEKILSGVEHGGYNIRGLTQAELNKIVDIGYSTFAAHRGVDPWIDLEHKLARFRFIAYPAEKQADNIKIRRIWLDSPYRCTMVVAARRLEDTGISFADDQRPLYLADKGDGITPVHNAEGDVLNAGQGYPLAPWQAGLGHWSAQTSTQLGESLMLPEGETYNMHIEYEESLPLTIGGEPQKVTRVADYIIKASALSGNNAPEQSDEDPAKFEAGKVYNISIAVYGSQKIEVYVNVKGWTQGGDIDIDEMDN